MRLSNFKKNKIIKVKGNKNKKQKKKQIAKDNEVFTIGDITVTVLHTPGHTMESTTYLLRDPSGKQHAIFTGDTLFLGDVGRPDLSQNSSMSNRDLASMLFDSLRNKIMTLSDDVIIYPGHGEGSSCGKDLSSETIGTLGDQKRINYALRENMTKDEFIKEVLDGLLDPPKYFPDNVMLNKEGYDESDEIINRSFNSLTANEVDNMLKEKITILDVRSVEDFSSSHIPGSIFIGLDGRFAPWVGEILEDVSKKLILIAPEGREKEAIIRLSRVGFDNVIGFLEGGINSWIKNGGIINKVLNESASKFSTIDNDKDILDVRSKNEHKSESLLNSINIPLIDLSKSIDKVSFEKTFYVHCKGGYRSMIAASILLANGISNFSNIPGGYDKIKNYNS